MNLLECLNADLKIYILRLLTFAQALLQVVDILLVCEENEQKIHS